MIDTLLSRPTALPSNSAIILDFLELESLIGPSGRAQIDALLRDRELQADEISNDFGDNDKIKDQIISGIEGEFRDRLKKLDDCYPFSMSDDGEEILLKKLDNYPLHGPYLTCLIAFHIGDGGDLNLTIPDSKGLRSKIITQMRCRVFQMIGTIALAGIANGSSASIGWPREKEETIIEIMTRAQKRGFPIPARSEPNWTASKQTKDSGVDVVAWEYTEGFPSLLTWFGQIASGRNWREKAVITDAKNFCTNFLSAPPWNSNYATIIPFQLNDEDDDSRALQYKHGYILDRLRLCVGWKQGFERINEDKKMDESENTSVATNWVNEFVQGLRTIAHAV